MKEIAAVPYNGLKVASTFSGCGGSSLGYRMAGFRVVYANEFIPAAQETYRANFPGTHLDARDIRIVRVSEILRAAQVREGELDLFDGSPPCASFSSSGKRQELWGQVKQYSDTKQRTDDLFEQYIRLVKGIRPRAFVAENVEGLVRGAALGMFKEIVRELKSIGYRVEAALLDAARLGVPQHRERIIIVGVRDDLNLRPRFPAPLPYTYSLRDALPHVTAYRVGLGSHSVYRPADTPAATIMAGDAKRKELSHFSGGGFIEAVTGEALTGDAAAEVSIERFAVGREWARVSVGGKSAKYQNLVKPDPDKPCPAITQKGGDVSAASVCHPTERRKFTIPELRRVCGFPDDFQLTGDFRRQWERLGRAVPPLMMRAVAETLRDEVLSTSPNFV